MLLTAASFRNVRNDRWIRGRCSCSLFINLWFSLHIKIDLVIFFTISDLYVTRICIIKSILPDLNISPSELQGLHVHFVIVIPIDLIDQLQEFSCCWLEVEGVLYQDLFKFVFVLWSPLEDLLCSTASKFRLEFSLTLWVSCRDGSSFVILLSDGCGNDRCGSSSFSLLILSLHNLVELDFFLSELSFTITEFIEQLALCLLLIPFLLCDSLFGHLNGFFEFPVNDISVEFLGTTWHSWGNILTSLL